MNVISKESDESTSGQNQSKPEQDPRDKLKGAIDLKDYAINANLAVNDTIIKKLNQADASKSLDSEHASNIDTALRDLTTITYPTTIETLRLSKGPRGLNPTARKFMRLLFILGPVVLLLALAAVWQSEADEKNILLWQSLIAVCLGFLGALVHIFLELIGVIVEKAFNTSDTYSNSARLVLGPIVGWVFFYAFGQDKGTSVLLLLPFVAGYSTRLVVGLINKAIGAIELTLGLEEKSIDLLRRKARRK